MQGECVAYKPLTLGKPSYETAAIRAGGPGKTRPDRTRRNDPRPVRPYRRHRARDTDRGRAGAAETDRSGEPAGGAGQSTAGRAGRTPRRLHGHRAQLFRPCRRNRGPSPARADPVHEGHALHYRPERRYPHPARFGQDRLGGRARRRHRQDGEICRRGRSSRPCRRLLHDQRCVGAGIPVRGHRAMGEGQGLRHVRPYRPLASHGGRGAGPAKISICGWRSTASAIRTAIPAR